MIAIYHVGTLPHQPLRVVNPRAIVENEDHCLPLMNVNQAYGQGL